jgi:hypothetical protein
LASAGQKVRRGGRDQFPGRTAEDHFKYWSSFYEKAPFLDGIIINEFIVNRPVAEWAEMTAERRARMERNGSSMESMGSHQENARRPA